MRDLGGNLFGGSQLTVTALSMTMVLYMNTSGNMLTSFQFALAADGRHITGTYSTTTLTFPPVASTTAFTLEPES